MRILFLGETYRADAQTWIKGLQEYGPFEVHTWELSQAGKGIKKVFRAIESLVRVIDLRYKAKKIKPDLVIAERTTSYGFLASTLHKSYPIAIAQQGVTDIYPPGSILIPVKKLMQKYAFRYASLIHAWGEVMTYSMIKSGADPLKIMILAKGIDLRKYTYHPEIKDFKIRAIVTRSLTPDYRHKIILKAFAKIREKGIPFELIFVGGGVLRKELEEEAKILKISDEVIFTGVIPNDDLPEYLQKSDLYISMPCTEGVSSSLFEAFASGCYPIVTDIPGNKAWVKDKINGRLITVDDVDALTLAIEDYSQARETLKNALDGNRLIVEEKVSFERNMKTICSRYKDLVSQFNTNVRNSRNS
jgi:glycosyltransferase involved in cell wall biosynthesis